MKGIKIFPKKRKEYGRKNMVANDLRIFQEMKNKGQFSLEKKILQNANKETLSYQFIRMNPIISFLKKV